MKKKLNSTYLIQRLIKPINSKNGEILNSFAFGGGLKNGGLSTKAMELLTPIFSFDYMGAAEFEWGAVPNSFKRIAEYIKEYAPWDIKINNRSVYIIGQKELESDIDKLLMQLSNNKVFLKESSGFDHALGLDKWMGDKDCRYIGWLELNNDFMFFTDKETFEKVCALFELTPKTTI